MIEDVKQRYLERDNGTQFKCERIVWDTFQASTPLNRHDDKLRYMTPKQRKKFIDDYRKTHDPISGIVANICVRDDYGNNESVKLKLQQCALESAKDIGIPRSGYKVEGAKMGEWDNCGMTEPSKTATSVKKQAEKERKEMERALEKDDIIGAKLHMDDMTRLMNQYANMDKTMCYCGSVKFYTGDAVVDNWRHKNG